MPIVLARKPTPSQLMRAADLASENAVACLRQAEGVAALGDTGRALSLLVLAEEEMAKSLILYFCGIGVLKDPRWLNHVLRRHEFKHFMLAAWVMLRAFTRLFFGDSIVDGGKRSQFGGEPWSPQRTLRHVVARLCDPEALTAILSDAVQELADLTGLGDLREAGMYVGFDADGRACSPRRFGQADVERRLHMVGRRLATLVSLGKQLADKAAAREIRDQLTNPVVRKGIRDLEAWLFKKDGVRIALAFLSSEEWRELTEEIVARTPWFCRKAAAFIKGDPRMDGLRVLIGDVDVPSQDTASKVMDKASE